MPYCENCGNFFYESKTLCETCREALNEKVTLKIRRYRKHNETAKRNSIIWRHRKYNETAKRNSKILREKDRRLIDYPRIDRPIDRPIVRSSNRNTLLDLLDTLKDERK